MRRIIISTVLLLLSCCGFSHLTRADALPSAHKEASDAPISLEIFRPEAPILYRSAISLRARFHNQIDTSVVLCLDGNINIPATDTSIRWYADDQRPVGFSYHNARRTGFILPPHENLDVILPPRFFFLGKHHVVVEYEDKQNGILPLKSNAFEIEVVDVQPGPDDLAKIKTKTRELVMDQLLSSSFLHQNKKREVLHREYIQNELLIYSPYSVPFLRGVFNTNSDPIEVIEILGMIADQKRAIARGYVRDTSSVDFVVQRLNEGTSVNVKTALLKIIGKFFDVLDQPQRKKLEKTVLAQLAHQDAGVRVQAALTLLELFPAQRPAIKTALAKPEFADEAGRKLVTEALAKPQGK